MSETATRRYRQVNESRGARSGPYEDLAGGRRGPFRARDGTAPAGRSPLLVIHGGPDWDHTYLLPGLELVAETRRVVAFDLRGCGRSTRSLGPAGYQPEFVVEDVERLIGILGYERVDLLGFSTGGQVAQLFIEAHPERVRRLVLASTTAYPHVDQYLDG